MRTLAIDALRLAGARTAMGRYIEMLVREWSADRPSFDRVVLHLPADAKLEGSELAPWIHVCRTERQMPLLAWEQAALPRAARGAALLFCPAYTAPIGHRGPLVVAKHGIYEAVPGEYGALARLRAVPLYRLAARRAVRVIADSEATRADLVRYLAAAPERIDVVPPGAAELFFAAHDQAAVSRTVQEVLGSRNRFVLFVGKLSTRRHVPALIEAFAAVRQRTGCTHRLLLVGPNVTGIDVASIAGRHGVGATVVYREHLDHPVLAHLYAAADVFALPTTYESNSWTIMEAMASGAPVLTIKHPALAEGGGEAVLTVPSAESREIANGLERLLCDPVLRAALTAKGRKRALQFTSRATAARTMEILDRVAMPADR